MTADPTRVRAIFLEAVEKHPPDTWDQFLDEACADDAELRRQVDSLLDAHRRAGPFLAQGAVAPARPVQPPPVPEAPGAIIGPYKLVEQISEGGFGVVFVAEQGEPIRRNVALKILKAGMDTRQVVARFEAERQALAIMDHPNIAQVFDGGATPSGRPYFVMELVKGVAITQYCDEHRLTPRQRLELFVPVCHAIQHAHQKGIIHRDLKPSNVLVARYDEKPVPKVIDFGVAKALGKHLTEQTLHTGFWAVVGTLEYMSPEQASFNQLDIDTRSDVYSLGILLYELLAGTTPLGQQRAKDAGLLEALRLIREEEAPTLSNRLGTTEELAAIAARRGLEPGKLTKLMSGELDWIVMKALEKDRNRRYETANALAADVQRYLADEPVQACPPSAAYRLRKFARRNREAVLAVTAIFLLLIAGICGTTWGLVHAEHAHQAEARQRKLAEAAVVSERAAKEAETQQRDRAEKAFRKAAREAAVATAINDFLNKDILQLTSPLGQAAHHLGPSANLTLRFLLLRAAQQIDGKFVKEPEVEMRIRYTLGTALHHVGDYAGAFAQYQKVIPYFQETLGPDHRETLLAEYRMAVLHRHLGHSKIALALLEQNLEKHKAVLGLQHAQTLASMNGLAMAYGSAGQNEKALQLAEETLALRKRHLRPDSGDTLVSMNNVAVLYLQQGQVEKALPLFEETLKRMQKRFAARHPERLNTTHNLARAYHAAEQIDKAIPLQELVLREFKNVYGLDYPMTQTIIDDLIAYYVDMGWCNKAQALLTSIQTGGDNRPTIVNQRRVVPVVPDRLGPIRLRAIQAPRTEKQRQDLREKHHRDLIQRVRPAADKYQQQLAAKKAEHPDTLAARQALGVALRTQSRYSAAAYHLRAVLETRQRLTGADHPDTQTCRLELGLTRLQQRKYAEAESLLLEAFAGMTQHASPVPKSGSRLVEALQRLVQLYDSWGKKDKADDWRRKLEDQKKR